MKELSYNTDSLHTVIGADYTLICALEANIMLHANYMLIKKFKYIYYICMNHGQQT